jgi:hypothetical protein
MGLLGFAGVVSGYWARWSTLCERPEFFFFFMEIKFWDGRVRVTDEISLFLLGCSFFLWFISESV